MSNKTDHDKLIAKFCYKITLRAESPISIGSGINIITDHDIIEYDNTYDPYIPGATIAGCFFGREENNHIFGIKTDKIKESPLFVSDGIFNNDFTLQLRDGTALCEDQKCSKLGAKFSTEIIETGAEFSFRVEYTIRKSNVCYLNKVTDSIKHILDKINQGLYRIGYKQTRGFGKLSVICDKTECFEFVGDKLSQYINFDIHKFTLNDKSGNNFYKYNPSCNELNIIELKAKCNIDGSFIIREYVKKSFDHLDYHMLETNGKPVIPASSINGVLRTNIRKILSELNISKLDDFINISKQKSCYTIDEAIIENSKKIRQSRTSIDRFSGGAKPGALMTEEVCVGGVTTIKVSFYNETKDYYVGLMILALRDIIEGYTPIGGETAIGRGNLVGKYEDFTINNKRLINDDGEFTKIASDYIQAILEYNSNLTEAL